MSKVYALISVGSQSLSGFLVLMICSRFMSIESFGIFSYLLLLGNLAAIFTDYGLLSGFQIELRRFRSDAENFLKLSIVVRFIFALFFVIMFASAVQVISFISKDILWAGCFVWLGFHFNNLLMQITTYLRFFGNFREDAFWNIFNFVLTTFIIGFAATYFDDLTIIGLFFFIAKLTPVCVFLLRNFEVVRASFSFKYFDWKKFFGFCGVNLIGYLYLNIDGVISGYFLEVHSLGEYRAIVTLMMTFSLGTNVLNHYFVPIWNTFDRLKLWEAYDRNTKFLFFYSILVMILYVISCDVLLACLFDISLDLKLSTKVIIALTIGLRYLSWAPGAALLIHGYNAQRIFALIFASCVAFLFAVIGFNLTGLEGGFWGLLSGHFTLYLVYIFVVRKLRYRNGA